MGRCDRRVWWRGAAGLCALALALLCGAAKARAQEAPRPQGEGGPGAAPVLAYAEATAPVPEQRDDAAHLRLPRNAPAPVAAAAAIGRRTGGGSSLEADLRRRLDDEERQQRTAIEEWKERELLRLFRECTEIPPESVQIGPGDGLSPSAVFLRAVSPLEDPYACVDRQGFDRWAAREVRRAWRRELAKDLARRRDESSSHFSQMEMDEEADRLTRALDEEAVTRWSRPFPMYWEGHPSAAPRESRKVGEQVEIIRLGSFTFDNDLSMRFDLREALLGPEYAFESDYDRQQDAQARRTEAARRAVANHRSHSAFEDELEPECVPPPHGNIFEGRFCAVDGKLHLSTGLSSLETGLVRETRGDLDFIFFSPYDGQRLFTVELQTMYAPSSNDTQVAVMLQLVRF